MEFFKLRLPFFTKSKIHFEFEIDILNLAETLWYTSFLLEHFNSGKPSKEDTLSD